MQSNTRPLLASNGVFHLSQSAKANGLSLCDFCDRRGLDCELPVRQEGCDDVVAPLFFQDPTGLDGRFTTFRASAVWYDRARAAARTHATVALITTDGHERIGRARVLDAHRGPFWALMEQHAHTNHLFKDQAINRTEAAAALTRWISKNMGSRFTKNPDAIGTVLSLERIT